MWDLIRAEQARLLSEHNEPPVFYCKSGNNLNIRVPYSPDYSVKFVKQMLTERTGLEPGEQWLTFGGKQLEDGFTLRDYNIQKESTIFETEGLLGGMGPRGIKKIQKAEKVHTIRAKATYATTQFTLQQGTDAFCQQVMQPDFISNKIRAMSLENLRELNEAIYSTSRSDQLQTVLREKLIPELLSLETQRANIENSITAVKNSFEVGFTEAYYADVNFKTDPLYNLVESEIEARILAQNQAASIEAEVQRRLAAMSNAAPAAMDM